MLVPITPPPMTTTRALPVIGAPAGHERPRSRPGRGGVLDAEPDAQDDVVGVAGRVAAGEDAAERDQVGARESSLPASASTIGPACSAAVSGSSTTTAAARRTTSVSTSLRVGSKEPTLTTAHPGASSAPVPTGVLLSVQAATIGRPATASSAVSTALVATPSSVARRRAARARRAGFEN